MDESQYDISETHMDKIEGLIAKKRYKSKDSFIDQAIEVFLTWEYNPLRTMEEMAKVRPTLDQYGYMIRMGIDHATLKQTYPNYPERFEDSWKTYLAGNPDVDELFQKITAQHDNQSDERASHKDYEQSIARKRDAENLIRTLNFSEKIEHSEEYFYDGYPLLFTHYSRLFPAKVAVLALAELMRSQDRKIINFEKFTAKAFDLCEEISERQSRRQEKVSRENNMSTGLPKPYSKNKTDAKQVEYQNRYKERYFGKIKRNKKDGRLYFEGLMSALNLIRIFKIDGEYNVTFTEQGKDFYLKQNPVFEGEYLTSSFYGDETKYILENLLLGKVLEIRLMSAALKIVGVFDEKMNSEKNITDYLDEAFENTLEEYCGLDKKEVYFERVREILDSTNKLKQEAASAKEAIDAESNPTEKENYRRIIKKQLPIEAIRIATMGRMSELDLVAWEIESGKSSYKTGNTELIKILNELAVK